MKKHLIWSIAAIFTVCIGFVSAASAVDVKWTDFSSLPGYYSSSGVITLCDEKTVTISIVNNSTSQTQLDGGTIGAPFFLDPHSTFENVQNIDYLRFRTRAASAEGNFNNAAPNAYTMTWDFPTPLDHTNFFVVGQLLQGNVATITAYAPDSSDVTSDLAFEQLTAQTGGFNFLEPLSWTAATGKLMKSTTTGGNSGWGFFSIPNGTEVKQIVIALVDDVSRGGSTADEVNYGIGCALPSNVDIDIKPQSDPNCFNINGHGVIPVAILGSADFDVRTIDITTLLFNGAAVRVRGKGSNTMCRYEYVSGDFINYPEGGPDGYEDLVCQFVDDPQYWTTGQTEATITGNLLDGTEIEGTDLICITQEIPEE
jgi:hypothetical protein